MCERIPGAQLIEIPGAGHLAVGRSGLPITEQVERFLTSLWESGGWDEPESDRVLSTVLFTEFVGSAERVTALGDKAWGELLSQHHAAIRRQLTWFRGRELDTAGDGFFASFDGPSTRDLLRYSLVANNTDAAGDERGASAGIPERPGADCVPVTSSKRRMIKSAARPLSADRRERWSRDQ
jgi:class 3 adenylate cyclase